MTDISPPLPNLPGMYVHIPFCASRCRYCSFVSNIYAAAKADMYLNSLSREIARRNAGLRNGISTLFIGGGTPSVLTAEQFRKLFSFILFPSCGGEATIEANPDSFSREKAELFREAGFTRISLGVQTFSEKGLHMLGRRHSAAAAANVVQLAVESGFSSVSLDLITAWPGQRLAELKSDLAIAVDLGVSHLSCYNVIIENDTPLAIAVDSGIVVQKDDDEVRRFWDCTETYLRDHGFVHYEVSNFAKPGFACRHNSNCWHGDEYYGFGAGAHSHLSGCRMANTAALDEYIAKASASLSVCSYMEKLPLLEKAREGATLWLRLRDGIDLAAFAQRYGIAFEILYKKELPSLLQEGSLVFDKNKTTVRLSENAFPLADLVLVDLV